MTVDAVLTLVAGERGMSEGAVSDASAAMAAAGARVGAADWLAPGLACDLPFAGLGAAAAMAAARAALAGRAIDAVAQAAEGRRKRVLVADMESTIIENEMLDELGAQIGIGEEVAAITRRAMNGEIEFEGAVRGRVALLKGLPEAALEAAARRIRVSPGARALVATMRAHGARTALVSGGFRFFTRPIAAQLGFELDVANEIEIEDGCLTGRAREPILGRAAKLETLRRLAAEAGVPLGATLAIGDGANDLGMIEAAGMGVAYRAKPAVAAQARVRIDHADLSALLYIQGYRAVEIVSQL